MIKYNLFFFLFLTFFTACSQQGSYKDQNSSYAEQAEMAPSTSDEEYSEQDQSSNDIPITERKIIRSADYRIQVKDVDQSTEGIESLVTSYRGFISNMNLTTNSYQINNRIVIRVPLEHFNNLMDAIGEHAIFTNNKTINSTDVTEEFVDIKTRLKTKKEVRDRYIDILKNKAKTVEDILKAEEKIRVIQEEIEAKEGRLRYLSQQASLSTIELNIYQKVSYQKIPNEYEKSFFEDFVQGLGNGWTIITGTVLVFANIWPLLILFGVLWFFRGRIWRRVRRK